MRIFNSSSTFVKVLSSLFTVALVTIIAVSCNDSVMNGSQSQSDKAQMNVHLTDAPANYDAVNINVQGLRIHYTPDTTDTADTSGEHHGKWVDLPVDPMTVNLLDFQNGVDTLLASTELDPGYYQELRLVLGGGNNVVIDSTQHYMKVPSGQQSGYKVKFATQVEAGEQIDLTIDFDAHRSVHKAGKSGKYMLRPVVRAFASSSDTVQSGSVAGIIEPAEASPRIMARMEQDTVATTQADTTGSFMLQGLDAGDYDLLIAPTNDSYSDTTVTDVSVEADEQTDVGTITLSQNE